MLGNFSFLSIYKRKFFALPSSLFIYLFLIWFEIYTQKKKKKKKYTRSLPDIQTETHPDPLHLVHEDIPSKIMGQSGMLNLIMGQRSFYYKIKLVANPCDAREN